MAFAFLVHYLRSSWVIVEAVYSSGSMCVVCGEAILPALVTGSLVTDGMLEQTCPNTRYSMYTDKCA